MRKDGNGGRKKVCTTSMLFTQEGKLINAVAINNINCGEEKRTKRKTKTLRLTRRICINAERKHKLKVTRVV